MVKANVDIILDYLKFKKSASVSEIAKATKIKEEDIKKSIEYLEEESLVKIDYKLTTPYVYLIEKENKKIANQEVNKEISNDKKDNIKKSVQLQNVSEIPLVITEPNENKLNDLNKKYEPNSSNANINIFLTDINKMPSNNLNFSNQYAFQDEKVSTNLKESAVLDNQKIINKEILSESPVKDKPEEKVDLVIDEDPLNQKRDFNFDISFNKNLEELNKTNKEKNENRDNKINNTENPILKSSLIYTSEKDFEIPDYIKKDSEKIDFLIEFGIKKIENYDYKDLNSLYRKAYNIFKYTDELSPNERYLIGEKLNDFFNRIKRVYMIEETAI